MSLKSKGINAERELIKLLWTKGWMPIRIAGSGSSPLPCPDILAGKNNRHLAIECKSSKNDNIYLDKIEIEELIEFSQKFGAEAWIGARFNNMDWFFMIPEKLKYTGKGYSISRKNIGEVGVSFEGLTEQNL